MSFIGLFYIFFGALGQYLVSHSRMVSLIVVLASLLFTILFVRIYADDRKYTMWRWFFPIFSITPTTRAFPIIKYLLLSDMAATVQFITAGISYGTQ